MTQYEIDILLKDLCARLPYGVKLVIDEMYLTEDMIKGGYDKTQELYGITYEGNVELLNMDYHMPVESIKPYLFPLSSMTEEQRIELYKALGLGYESHYHLSKEWEDFNNSINNNALFLPASWVSDLNKMYNYLNKNHFDYRGLIPMGLANDATGKNIY